MIDEFHTSKLHNACGQSMTNAYCHKHAKQSPHGQSGTSDRVHQVLICSNRCCLGPAARMGMHRDKNAAMNMLCLLRLQLCNQPRPPPIKQSSRIITACGGSCRHGSATVSFSRQTVISLKAKSNSCTGSKVHHTQLDAKMVAGWEPGGCELAQYGNSLQSAQAFS